MAKLPVDAPKAKVLAALRGLGFEMIAEREHIALLRHNPDGTRTRSRCQTTVISKAPPSALSAANPASAGKTSSARMKRPDLAGGRYEMIVRWSDEDHAYVVEVPELPGCVAHGATRQKAIRNAENAVRLWLKTAQEDRLVIVPRRGLAPLSFSRSDSGALIPFSPAW